MKTIKFIAIFIMVFGFVYASAEAFEKRLKLISTDEGTGTRFSVIEQIGGMIGSDPCESGGYGGGIDVIGEIPTNISLADDATAKYLVEKGKESAIRACPEFNLSNGELRISLFKGEYNLGQNRKPEVFAKWIRVYRRFHEAAIRKGPTEYYNKEFERFEKEQLAQERAKAGEDASKIVVTSIQKLDTNSSYPRFSPDGSKILYTKEERPPKNRPGQSFQVKIIKDVKTRNTIKIFGKDGIGWSKGAWSPDSKKIAYITTYPIIGGDKPKLNIYDIASGKIISLDYKPPYWGFIVWVADQEIYVLETGRAGSSLNLETLKESRLPKDVSTQFLKDAPKSWWSDVSKHKYCYIYRQDVKGGRPSLIVANKDNSYARVLIKEVYDQHPYVISPDLTSIVYARADNLYIAYLGKRDDPITTFRIQLNDDAFNEKLDKALKNNVTINGTVFGSRINPLNNMLVGPDKKIFKGYIKFTGSDGSHYIVTTTFENEPFGDGDIVAEIYAEDGSIGRGSLGRLDTEVWAVLKNISQSTLTTQSKETPQKSYPESSNIDKPPVPYEDKGACPFECCTYREWVANKETNILKDMEKDSQIAFKVRKGEKVSGVAGVVITTNPGIAKVKKPIEIDGTLANIGDTVYLLTYEGEGAYKVWYKGKIKANLDIMDNIEILKTPESIWWVKIKNKKGKTGWSYQPENFGNKDACG